MKLLLLLCAALLLLTPAASVGIGCDDEYEQMCSDVPKEDGVQKMVQCLSMQPQKKLGRWCKEWMHVMAQCIEDVTGEGRCGTKELLRDKYVCISMWAKPEELATQRGRVAQAGAMKGAKIVEGVPGGSVTGGGGTHQRMHAEKLAKAELEAKEKEKKARKKRNAAVRKRNKARRRKAGGKKKRKRRASEAKKKEDHQDL